MKKIKILFVIPSITGGGSERVVSHLVNYLDRSRFEVILVVIHKQVKFSYQINANKYYNLSCKRVLFSFLKLNRVIKFEKPDIIFSTLTYVNTFIGLLDLFFRYDSLLIARESTIPSINNKGRISIFKNFLLNVAYKRFDNFICQSFAMKDDLTENYKINANNIEVIYNPVKVPDARKEIFSNSSIPTFITIAMLRPEKGIIRIIDSLNDIDFNFIYHIVGSGSELKSLKSRVDSLGLNNCIKFHGFMEDPSDLLIKSDVFLQGSFYEGFSNSLLESCVYGVPIFAFDSFGGTNELIIDGVNGKIFKSQNEFNFALKNKFWLNFDKNTIKETTILKYNMEKIITQYENFFQSKMNDKV